MSDNPDWKWRGFYGPMATVAAAYAAHHVNALGGLIGVRVPEGEPIAVDVDGQDGMFAVQIPPDAEIATPAGLKRANDAMVGRMTGA